MLLTKAISLTGGEIRFMRLFLELSKEKFGKLFGVTHPAVIKWENDQAHINPATEKCIRLYVLDHLKVTDREFRMIFKKIIVENLRKQGKSNKIFTIDDLEEFKMAS